MSPETNLNLLVGSETFTPPVPLDIATIEGYIVGQLAAALGNVVEVTHFPDRPEAYEMRHRIGEVLVIYHGSTYDELRDVGIVEQERTMTFAIAVKIRDLGWAYGGPPSGPSPGAYQILEGIRLALTGFKPLGCTKFKPVKEEFIQRDPQGAVWIYEMHFNTRTVAVEAYEPPTWPLFTHGTAQEEAGITAVPVSGTLTFTGNPGTINLIAGNISHLLVSTTNFLTIYTLGTDYLLDSVNGIITRIVSGSIPANATVAVGYSYSDIVTILASGGSVPFSPTN